MDVASPYEKLLERTDPIDRDIQLKADLLIAVGIGAVKLIHDGGDGTLEHWVAMLGVTRDDRYVDRAISK